MIVKIVICVKELRVILKKIEELLQKARNLWERNTFRAMLLFYLTTPSSMAPWQSNAQPSRLMFWAAYLAEFRMMWPEKLIVASDLCEKTQKYHCFCLFDAFRNFLLWPVIKCMCRGKFMYISNWKSKFRSAQKLKALFFIDHH